MSNDVRIGVSADTSNTSSGLGNVEKSARKVADGVKEIDKAAKQAAISMQRLEAVAKILSREMGKVINPKQAEAFIRNFDAIRGNRHVTGGSKLRQFDSFEDWHARNNSMFLNQREAERYKRRVYNLAGQGAGLPFIQPGHPGQPANTPYNQPSGNKPAIVERYGQWKSGFKNEHKDLVAGAKIGGGMIGAGLAFAGVTSIMAMAGRAVDLARQESTSQDQLLRTVGDLDKTFDDLRDRVRESGKGLGVLYTEAAALGKHYANITNGKGGDIGENLRTGFGLSRAYGLELSEGVSYMGQARHLGQVGADDQNGRKFAMMIAESIEKGANTGKAGEVLAAVSNFSSQVARFALTAPNAAGFAGALAGMTASHTPGLDPTNAAQILMTADNAIRQGGGMGEAGLNFSYGALSREMPGLNPILFKTIMGQGAFGSGISGEMSKYLGGQGVDVGGLGLSKTSNMELLKAELERQNIDPFIKIESFKNLLGLQSTDHAAALYNMQPQDVARVQRVMGDDMGNLTASGMQNVGRIAAAGEPELRQIADRLVGDKRFTDLERSDMGKALEKGDMEGLRDVMIKAVGVQEQQENIGSETRDAVVGLNNALTKAGGGILPVLTGIQEAVVAMARVAAPESEYAKQLDLKENYGKYKAERSSMDDYQTTYMDGLVKSLDKNGADPEKREVLIRRTKERFASDRKKLENKYKGMSEYEKSLERNKEAAAVSELGALDLGPRPDAAPGETSVSPGDTPASPGEAANKVGQVTFTEEELASMRRATGGDPRKMRIMQTILAVENRGFGKVNNAAVSGVGAKGAFQFMPDTAKSYGLSDPTDFDASAMAAAKMIGDLDKQYGGNERAMLAHYNGGTKAGRAVADGGIAPSSQTREYLSLADGYTGGVPGGKTATQIPTMRAEISFNGTVRDSSQRVIADIEPGQATIQPPTYQGANFL